MQTLEELRANEKIWAHLILWLICPFSWVISVSKLRYMTPAYVVIGAASLAIIGTPAQFFSGQEKPSPAGVAIRSLIPIVSTGGGSSGATMILPTRESESDSFANGLKYAFAGNILGSTLAIGVILESRWKVKSTK